MRRQILASIAALLLLTACQARPNQTADAVNAGAAGGGAGAGIGTAPVAGGGGGGGAQTAAVTPPRPGGPGTAEEFNLTVGDRIFFDFDSFALTPQARATLDRQAQWLRQYGDVRVTIEGHADERGTREYNLALGERRANSVRDYLSALGVQANRLTVVSYGKERPVALGSNETAWALNRRGVTSIQTGARFN